VVLVYHEAAAPASKREVAIWRKVQYNGEKCAAGGTKNDSGYWTAFV
jgi:hypothetical protein